MTFSGRIRITHIPTDTTVECDLYRDDAKNREVAMRVMRAKLYEMQHPNQYKVKPPVTHSPQIPVETVRFQAELRSAGWGKPSRVRFTDIIIDD